MLETALLHPLFGLGLTVTAYLVAAALWDRLGRPAIFHPVLVATLLVIAALVVSGLARRTLTGMRVEECVLADLDSAELSRNPRRGSGAIDLVFTNTRPATRIPVTGWGVPRGGMAPLAQKINDWLSQVKDRD